MLYEELYKIWKRELESFEFEKLPSSFFSEVVEYIKRLKNESRMLDRRTAKAALLHREVSGVKFMVHEIIQTRYKKVVKKMAVSEKIASDFLAVEERKIYTSFPVLVDEYRLFVKEILDGHIPSANIQIKRNRMVLRFNKEVPAVIGVDMKIYGPFDVEDVVSLPIENAEVMIKRDLAGKVEIS